MDIEAESVVHRCEAMGALENLGLYDLAEHLDTFKEAARTIRRMVKEKEALQRTLDRIESQSVPRCTYLLNRGPK